MGRFDHSSTNLHREGVTKAKRRHESAEGTDGREGDTLLRVGGTGLVTSDLTAVTTAMAQTRDKGESISRLSFALNGASTVFQRDWVSPGRWLVSSCHKCGPSPALESPAQLRGRFLTLEA